MHRVRRFRSVTVVTGGLEVLTFRCAEVANLRVETVTSRMDVLRMGTLVEDVSAQAAWLELRPEANAADAVRSDAAGLPFNLLLRSQDPVKLVVHFSGLGNERLTLPFDGPGVRRRVDLRDGFLNIWLATEG